MPTIVASGSYTIVDITDGGHKNLLDSSTWVVGSTGSQPGFVATGLTGSSVIELGIDPYGRSNPLWKIIETNTSNPMDGAFTTDLVPVNASRTYRFLLCCRRSSETNGSFSLGAKSNGPNGGALTLAGGSSSLPVFNNGDVPVANRWYLYVGYVHGTDTTVSASIGGIYDMTTGSKYLACTDYKWQIGTTKAQLTINLASSTTLGNTAHLWGPSIELCDGTEEPVESLIAARASDYQIGQMASDSIITPQEKMQVLGRWCEIVNDVAPGAIPTAYDGSVGDGRFKTLRDKAYACGIWTPTTTMTASKNFYDAAEGLRLYLFSSPAVIASSTWATNIAITKMTWNTLWMTYAAMADALQVAIGEASLDAVIQDMASDSIIHPTEKVALLRRWEELKAEYTEIMNRASACGLLVSSSTEMTNLQTHQGTMQAYLYTTPAVLADLVSPTSIDPDEFLSLWTNYSTLREALVSAIERKVQENTAGGVFVGTLNSSLIRSMKAVSAQSISSPLFTHWSGSTFYFHYYSLTLNAWYNCSGSIGSATITAICRTSSSIAFDTSAGGIWIHNNACYNSSVTVVLTTPFSDTYIPSTAYYAGSVWIATMVAAGLPQGMDISFSANQYWSSVGRTLLKFNYNTNRIIFTFTDAWTLTILSTDYSNVSGSGFSIPTQGSDYIDIAGQVKATIGTIYEEKWDTPNTGQGHIKFADGTLICWKDYAATTGEITWTFPHTFVNASWVLAGTALRNSTSNSLVGIIVRTRSTTQAYCRILYSQGLSYGMASEPVCLIVLGRWK